MLHGQVVLNGLLLLGYSEYHFSPPYLSLSLRCSHLCSASAWISSSLLLVSFSSNKCLSRRSRCSMLADAVTFVDAVPGSVHSVEGPPMSRFLLIRRPRARALSTSLVMCTIRRQLRRSKVGNSRRRRKCSSFVDASVNASRLVSFVCLYHYVLASEDALPQESRQS
jgi:hypothetical protein